jgi:hypothetical protein
LYYSSSIYTIIGSLADATEGDNTALKTCLQENQDDLEKNMADVYEGGTKKTEEEQLEDL